jgi:hypothetical protein
LPRGVRVDTQPYSSSISAPMTEVEIRPRT